MYSGLSQGEKTLVVETAKGETCSSMEAFKEALASILI
jgi:hypothetical protein